MSGFKVETQNPKELEQFLEFIKEKKINLYFEIGLYSGSTFKAVYDTLMEVWGDSSKFLCIGIDLPQNVEAFKVCRETVENLDNVVIHWVSSTDPQAVEEIHQAMHEFALRDNPEATHYTRLTDGPNSWKKLFPVNSLMFIDGDHSYTQTKDDWQAYANNFDYAAFNDVSPKTLQQNRDKHKALGNRDLATAYHVYDGLKLGGVEEVAYFEDHEASKARGIGILTP